ncbi:COG4223 family protein [Mesorhizobium sp. 1B3]|uniref:COG4223 family protein n=1 Tax=Mesorhizobium sp. 1B3 TaxID=3243599 RepID=UPI003D971787
MVKTPKTRHSKAHRDPVTIDLGPEEVSRIEEPKPDAGNDTAAEETAAPETPTADGDSFREAPAEAREPEGDKSLDDELTAKIGSEPPYTSAFGRSAGDEQADAEQDEPSGTGRGLLAGLAGGVIALLGAGALQYAGLVPAPGNAETNSLHTEIGVLRQEINGLKDSAGVADAEGFRKVLSDSNARVDGLATSLDKVASDLAGLRDAASSGGAGDGAAVQALDQKIKELESALAALGDGGGVQALGALNEKIASVESALAAAKTTADAANARLAGLEEKVAGISEKLEEQAGQPRVALAIAASGLKAALDRGGPFATELDTFAAVAPDAPELPELRPFAEKGVPSRDDLVAATAAAANAMVDASQVVDENAGIVDRLVASAKSMVKVRPTGAVEGEGVPEKVARLEAAVKEGNLAKALAEYDSLPEASRAAGAGFAESLRGRLKVEELVDKALAGALKPA